MSERRVAIVAGARTPFVKAGKALSELGPLQLARGTIRGMIDRHGIDPSRVDAITFGVTIPEPGKPNLAREIVFEENLPRGIEGQTIASYCITGLRCVTSVADGILAGRLECGIAGGVDSLSRSDPGTFKEPSTGLTMGQHMEITSKEWEIPRERQDEIALASHRNAVAAREKLAEEIVPIAGIREDTGPRADSSAEALAALKPVFDEEGTLTAGNSSPVTDGASAVLLMSESRAREEGREPLAFVKAIRFAAIDPDDGLLMAPAVAVPRILADSGFGLADFDLIEIHEAFAAQVLANVAAWEKGFKGAASDPVDWSRVNVNGGSIALGHPWAATGGRIVTTLACEMSRRGSGRGLISICAAGAMAGALVLER